MTSIIQGIHIARVWWVLVVNILLIDDRGEFWGTATISLRKSFGPTWSDEDFSQYVVKNIGFVAINVFGKSCQVRIRPKFVSSHAFASLTEWLSERRFARIVISHFDDDWKLELHPGNPHALRRLAELVSQVQLARPNDFLVRKLPITAAPKIPALHSLFSNWGNLSRSLHSDGLRNMLNQLTSGRYLLVREDAEAGRIMLSDVGKGYFSLDDQWIAKAPGTPIEMQPDRAYGEWVAGSYRSVLQRSMPSVDAVDAIVSQSKYGRYRVRYNRLMLPFNSADGSKWLLCSSVLDESIDLRTQQAVGEAG